jgi:hypothetical protein
MEFNFKKITLGIALSLGLFGLGCGEDRRSLEVECVSLKTIPVDQVFRDNEGFRVYYTNSNEEVIETNFSSFNWWEINYRERIVSTSTLKEFKGKPEESPVRVFKNLEESQRGHAKTMTYQISAKGTNSFLRVGRRKFEYTEIYLPRNGSLMPGNDSYRRGKQTVHSPMGEIK